VRIRELDSLRGIASLGVVLFHYSITFGARPAAGVLQPFYNYGFFLVDFFFVLSGFVLSHAYDTDRKRGDLRTNSIKRVARIYPLHLLTLLVTAGIYLVFTRGFDLVSFRRQGNDAYHFVLNLLLLQRVGLQKYESFNNPSWSISTEFWVSIGFFLVIAFARRKALVYAAFVALSFVLLITASEQTIAAGQELWFTDVCLTRNVLGFCIGALLFMLFRPRSQSIGADVAWLAAVLAFVWLTAFAQVSMKTVFFVSTCAIFPALLVATLYSRFASLVLRHKALTLLGDISYSTYLVHLPLMLLLKGALAVLGVDVDWAHPAVLAAFCVVLIALSWVCFERFERPAQSWINARFAGPRPGARGA